MTLRTPELLTIGANLGGEVPSLVTIEELLGRILPGDSGSTRLEATLFSPIVGSEETSHIDYQKLTNEQRLASVATLETSVSHERVSVLGLASILTVFEEAGVRLDNEKGISGQRSKSFLSETSGKEAKIKHKPRRFGSDFDRLIGTSPLLDSLSVAVGALVRRNKFSRVSMHFILDQQPLILTLEPNEVDRNNALSLSARLTREARGNQ